MDSIHFLTKALPRVSTETGLNALTYNRKRMTGYLECRFPILAMAG